VLRCILVFVFFALGCARGAPPAPQEGTVRWGAREVRVVYRATVAQRHDPFGPVLAKRTAVPILVAYDRDRYVHLHTAEVPHAFVAWFLASDGAVVDRQRLGRYDEIGVTSQKEARYALLLPAEEFGDAEPPEAVQIEPMPRLQPMPEVVFPGGARLRVELARTERERKRGLMYRTAISRDEGMLFLYPSEQPGHTGGFWMNNTHVPLSLAYISKDGEVVHLVDMEPRTTILHPCPQRWQYALEAPRGWFAEHGVSAGTKVEWPEGFEEWRRQAQ
jgi:uncharacterized membrane protein (UPF0127 family)